MNVGEKSFKNDFWRVEGRWEGRINQELRTLYDIPDIIKVIKAQRVGYRKNCY